MNDITAQFSIELHQLLDETGQLKTLSPPPFIQDKKFILHLYRTLVLMRTFDQKAVALQRTGKIGTYAGILGQEAIAIALGAALKPEDVLCPAYREYGAMVQRGVNLHEILAFWGGDERGSAYANSHDFPICVPIATQCLHAAGIASAFKIKNQAKVAAVVIGDGGTSQGDFYEALNVAGDWKLPLVFIINNNQWAISVPRSAQTGAETLAQKAIAAGIEGVQVDGNDIFAMFDRCTAAIEKARAGGGPTVIEALTYRLCDHTTADDAKRYRPEGELEIAWKKEPILRLKAYLNQTGVLNETLEQEIQQQCTEEVETAVTHYLAMEPPAPESMFDYHYAELTSELKTQREAFLEMLACQK